jgi:hypothetical protein
MYYNEQIVKKVLRRGQFSLTFSRFGCIKVNLRSVAILELSEIEYRSVGNPKNNPLIPDTIRPAQGDSRGYFFAKAHLSKKRDGQK